MDIVLQIFQSFQRRWENEHQVEWERCPCNHSRKFSAKGRAHIMKQIEAEIRLYSYTLFGKSSSVAVVTRPDYEAPSVMLQQSTPPTRIPTRYRDVQGREHSIDGVEIMTKCIARIADPNRSQVSLLSLVAPYRLCVVPKIRLTLAVFGNRQDAAYDEV